MGGRETGPEKGRGREGERGGGGGGARERQTVGDRDTERDSDRADRQTERGGGGGDRDLIRTWGSFVDRRNYPRVAITCNNKPRPRRNAVVCGTEGQVGD